MKSSKYKMGNINIKSASNHCKSIYIVDKGEKSEKNFSCFLCFRSRSVDFPEEQISSVQATDFTGYPRQQETVRWFSRWKRVFGEHNRSTETSPDRSKYYSSSFSARRRYYSSSFSARRRYYSPLRWYSDVNTRTFNGSFITVIRWMSYF